ncbi:hypothetical protein ADK91_15230, partial [Streptomyces sp. XY511]
MATARPFVGFGRHRGLAPHGGGGAFGGGGEGADGVGPSGDDPPQVLRRAGVARVAAGHAGDHDRVVEVTGITLPATAVFDHPTPTALAEFLAGQLA